MRAGAAGCSMTRFWATWSPSTITNSGELRRAGRPRFDPGPATDAQVGAGMTRQSRALRQRSCTAPSEGPIESAIVSVTTFGLARTPAQIGMLNSLAEREIPLDYAVGTSLGSVNAAALAVGWGTDEMRDFWMWMEDVVLGGPVRTVARSMSARQSRKQAEEIIERLREFLARRLGR